MEDARQGACIIVGRKCAALPWETVHLLLVDGKLLQCHRRVCLLLGNVYCPGATGGRVVFRGSDLHGRGCVLLYWAETGLCYR